MVVDKKTKHLKIDSVSPRKSLWEFSKKEECDSIVQKKTNNFPSIGIQEKKFSQVKQ